MIEITAPAAALLSAAATGVVVFLGCRWWFGRSLSALAHKLHRVEQARAAASERSKQARQQVGKLQEMIAELQAARSTAARGIRPERSSVAASPPPQAHAEADADEPFEPFAQTQVLRP